MSVQFKTISQVITGLAKCGDGNDQTKLAQPTHLRKVNVEFLPSNPKTSPNCKMNQKYKIVKWDCEEFNNLDIAIAAETHSGGGDCSASCLTIGELIKQLTEFKNKYSNEQSYSVTYQLNLLDDDIIEERPSFKTNRIAWHQTTLVDGFKASDVVTNHLRELLQNMDRAKYPDMFQFVQDFIKTHPSAPKDYKAYLIPNFVAKSDSSAVGFQVFHSLQSAKDYLRSIGQSEIVVGKSTTFILDTPQLFKPHSTEKTNAVYIYNALFIASIRNDIELLEQKLGNLDV